MPGFKPRAVSPWTIITLSVLLSSFYDALTKAVADRVYAIEIDLFATLTDTLITTYFSDRGYISLPVDSLANTYFDGRAKIPLQMERSIPLSPGQNRRVAFQLGNIVMANNDGLMDSYYNDYSVDGRRVQVKLGLRDSAYSGFGTIFNGSGVAIELTNNEWSIVLRDNGYKAEKQLQATLYAGTGGKEGGDNIKGKPKPVCYGKVLNIAPTLIDTTNNIYQFHYQQAESVDAVYDRGAALTDSTTDVADYATLAALSVSSGQFATCLAEGMIKLGTAPTGLVTADVKGDASGSGYVNKTGAICYRILTTLGGLSSTEVNQPIFDSLDAIQPSVVGWFTDNVMLVSDALDDIMGGINAYWGANRNGTIICGRLEAPDPSGAYSIDLTTVEIIDCEQLALPRDIDPPTWRRRLNYQKNWTVQRGEDLAGTVSQARRQFLVDQFRNVSSSDTDVRDDYLLANDPDPLQTYFDDVNDAQDESDRLLDMYKTKRQLIVAKLKTVGHSVDLGETVKVTWPRFGLGSGKKFKVVGIREDCDQRFVELTLWG